MTPADPIRLAAAFGPPAYTFAIRYVMLGLLVRALQRIARSYASHGLADDEEGRPEVLAALALAEAASKVMLDAPHSGSAGLMLPVDDARTLHGLRHGFQVLLSTLDDRRKHNMAERVWVRRLLDSIEEELDRSPIDRLAGLTNGPRDLTPTSSVDL